MDMCERADAVHLVCICVNEQMIPLPGRSIYLLPPCSTPTTSSTRTGGPSTLRPSGTLSTGSRWGAVERRAEYR